MDGIGVADRSLARERGGRYNVDHMAVEKPTLSIVVPAYNEAGNLGELIERIRAALSDEPSWELIVVDDGSTDDTWRTVRRLNEGHTQIKGISLSRNFGHQYALFAGLAHAGGEAVITMDADLQHPPSLIPELLERWRDGAMIVHTVRKDSGREFFLKRLTSRLYFRFFSFLSGVRIEAGIGDFRLLDRRVVDALLDFKEAGLFVRGIVQWVGFPSARVEYKSGKRFSGSSSYSLGRMIELAWSGITSFSLVPLRIGILIGLLTALLAFAELVYAVAVKLFTDSTVPGWASAVSVVSLLFGVLFILLGLLGEYIGRALVEARRRPRYVVADTVGLGESH